MIPSLNMFLSNGPGSDCLMIVRQEDHKIREREVTTYFIKKKINHSFIVQKIVQWVSQIVHVKLYLLVATAIESLEPNTFLKAFQCHLHHSWHHRCLEKKDDINLLDREIHNIHLKEHHPWKTHNRFSSSQACADGGSTAAWIEQGHNAHYKTFNSSLDIPWTLNCNIYLVKLEFCKDLNSFSEKLCDISFQQLVSCSVRHIGAMRSARIAILPCWGTSRGAYTAWTVSMSVCSSGAWVKQLLYFPF
jgi:hypothetical protein